MFNILVNLIPTDCQLSLRVNYQYIKLFLMSKLFNVIFRLLGK